MALLKACPVVRALAHSRSLRGVSRPKCVLGWAWLQLGLLAVTLADLAKIGAPCMRWRGGGKRACPDFSGRGATRLPKRDHRHRREDATDEEVGEARNQRGIGVEVVVRRAVEKQQARRSDQQEEGVNQGCAHGQPESRAYGGLVCPVALSVKSKNRDARLRAK